MHQRVIGNECLPTENNKQSTRALETPQKPRSFSFLSEVLLVQSIEISFSIDKKCDRK
jgi:hypothetical protein